jgi:hypothetical protein
MRGKISTYGLILALVFGIGCTRESKLNSITSPLNDFEDCLSIFPDHPWEAVHRIEAKLGVRSSFSFIGLTKGDPAKRTLRCALLSAEGFVIFEGEQREDHLSIIRAMPPFDTSAFAKGLIEDVELIFFAPQGRPSESGTAADGAFVCRWIEPSGAFKEIMRTNSDSWKISLWKDQRNMRREVWLTKRSTENFVSQVELHALGVHDYWLKMVLLR